MIREGYTPMEIFSVWNSLYLEGWLSDERMPREWKMKIVSGSYHFLSPMMDVIESKSELLAAVTVSKGYSQEDVNKIKHFCE